MWDENNRNSRNERGGSNQALKINYLKAPLISES